MQFLLKHWRVSERDNVITDTVDNKQHKIEPKTMAVLMLLIHRYGEVVSRDEFCTEVWNGRVTVDESLTRCISELRRIFNDSPKSAQVIKTIHKKGYKLLVRPEEIPASEEEVLLPDGRSLSRRIGMMLVVIVVVTGSVAFFVAEEQKPVAENRLTTQNGSRLVSQFASLSEIRNSLPVIAAPGQSYSWNDPRSGKAYEIVVSKVAPEGAAPDTLRFQVIDSAKNVVWDAQRSIDGNANIQPAFNDVAQVLLMAGNQRDAPELKTLSQEQRHTYKRAMYLIDKRGKANLIKAIALLDGLLDSRPDFVMALIQKAVAVRNLGFYETATEQKKQQMIQYELLLKQAVVVAPAHPVVTAMNYEFNAEQPNWLAYESALKEAVQFAPGCAICVRLLAEFYVNVGYYEKAEALVVYHLDYFPLSTMMHSFLGQLYSKQGDLIKTGHQADVLAALKSQDAFDTFSVRFNAAVMKEDEKAVRELLDTIVQKHPAFETHKEIMLAQIDSSYEHVKKLIAQMPRTDFNLAITAGNFRVVHERMLRNIRNGQVRDIGLLHGWLAPANALYRYYPENLRKFKNHPTTVALLRDVGLFNYWRQKGQWPDYCRLEKYRPQRPDFCDESYF